MRLVFCKSKNNGLWFIDRRQSADRVVVNKIVSEAKAHNATVWISEYSKGLFSKAEYEKISIIKKDSVFGEKDLVFIEDLDLSKFLSKADSLTIIDWNRDYPATKYFKESLEDFVLTEESQMKGHSHDEIIVKSYEKKRKKKA